MLRPGDVARPAPARAFTTELAWAGSPRTPTSVITGWLIVILPSPDFHRLDWQPYGLRAKIAKNWPQADLEIHCFLFLRSLPSFAAQNEIARRQARGNQSESVVEGLYSGRRKGCGH